MSPRVRGSNVLSKGHDGFTPLGPLVDAADVDPAAIGLRTLVNGNVAQDDSTANLLFAIGLLVADLSRFMTLEPGDIILTGTPSGTSRCRASRTYTCKSGIGTPITLPDRRSSLESGR